uniref:Calcineurin-like phosphoesterase domain-containing protein n=2 Tax=Opuntia streptacantha TaxID=393608 RepID=A0A7C9DIW6_OPUST
MAHSRSRSTRIAVVGDVHDDWDLEADAKALHFLQPDLVLFTGDFGNENVELVRSISELKMPKAVILGNHDCVFTRQFSQKVKDGVQLQLECLGEDHVGYNRLDFPSLKLSVVGGRPFSHGGKQLCRKELLAMRYGVHNMEESAERIYAASRGTPEDHFLIFLAHNGPTGLGSNMDDICGKDWVYGGGDHGDADLAQALSRLKETTKYPMPLIVFGHMHKGLAYGGLRKMLVIGADGTMYLNGAIVPRVRYTGSGGSIRAFTVVEFAGSEVNKIAEAWVSLNNGDTVLEEESVLFKMGAEVRCHCDVTD